MRKLILAVVICLTAAACQTPQQSAGTATGVVAGAVVGGPVGAVVGGVVGATATAPGGPLSPGIATCRTGVANSYMTAPADHSSGAAPRKAPRRGWYIAAHLSPHASRGLPPPFGAVFFC